MDAITDKAKELYDKFFDLAYVSWMGGKDEMTQEEAAKECAIICCDEKLETLLSIIGNEEQFWTENEKDTYGIIKSVKEKIKTL